MKAKLGLLNKKGQSFALAGSILFGIVSFAVFILVMFLILGNVTTLTPDNRVTYTVLNEAGRLNATGYQLASANSTTAAYTITGIKNATTNGAGTYNWTIGLANASVSATGLVTNLSTGYNLVKFNYTYTDQGQEVYLTTNIKNNVTAGVGQISSNLGTIFSIIGMLIVLSIIGLLILVVKKYGFAGGGGSFGQ